VKPEAEAALDGQRGFSLIEVLAASALTIAVILAVSGAVLASLHATALADDRAALADDALNVITDVRAATAYDAALLARLAGRSATTSVPRASGGLETIAVAIDAGARPTVTVTASDGAVSATERQRLYNEAPPPGSTQ